MIFWIAVAVLSVGAAALLAAAVGRNDEPERSAAAYDVEIYRDQLKELDEDVERGVLSPADAQGARAEISRKLIAATQRLDAASATPPIRSRGRRIAALTVLIGLPFLAFVLYLLQGAPGLPGQPFRARLEERQRLEEAAQRIAEEIDTLEAKVAADPTDVESWRTLGLAYMGVRRYADAADSFERAMKATGKTADFLLNRGVALVFANDGFITPRAEETFTAALEKNPSEGLAHYFLGFAALQRKDTEAAARHLEASLEDSPPDAPWLEQTRQVLASLEGQPTSAQPPAETAPPPNVEEMVTRLAARLEIEPHDLDGWLMLIRSYSVLGDTAQARVAFATAREEFAGDAAALARLETLAAELELDAPPP